MEDHNDVFSFVQMIAEVLKPSNAQHNKPPT